MLFISIKPKYTKILFNFNIQAQHSPFDCTGKKCGDMCEIAFSSRTGRTGERDMGTCNNLGNCLKIFEPNCGKSKHSERTYVKRSYLMGHLYLH